MDLSSWVYSQFTSSLSGQPKQMLVPKNTINKTINCCLPYTSIYNNNSTK